MEVEKISFLSSQEREKLLSCLGNPQNSLGEIERKFKSSFKSGDFNAVTNELACLSRELIVSAEGASLICSLFLIHLMMKSGYTSAKSAFYGMLVQLERALKKDMYDAQEKKFLSKESDENKKSLEAARSDTYRIHSSAKVFAFHLLNDTMLVERKVLEIISQKQESIDSQIEKFEQQSSTIHAAISDMFEYWKADNEMNKCSSIMESCTLFGRTNIKNASICLPALTTKLPSAPVLPGELQFFLPDAQDSSLLFYSKS